MEVVSISGGTCLGQVKLPDGRIIKDIILSGYNTGDMLVMKISKIDGSGNITALKF